MEAIAKEWNILLEAEDVRNLWISTNRAQGQELKVLESIQWRSSPFIRSTFLAAEQDVLAGDRVSDYAAFSQILVPCIKHEGDSRKIESTHQVAKDQGRVGRHFIAGSTKVQQMCISSNVLKHQKHITIPQAEKARALSSIWQFQKSGGPYKPKTQPGGKNQILPLDMQLIMAKAGSADHEKWVSPTPESVVNSVMATQWLFTSWRNPTFAGVNLDDAWLSIAAGKAGSIIINLPESRVIKVLLSAKYAFLGIDMVLHGHSSSGGAQFRPVFLERCIQFLHITL